MAYDIKVHPHAAGAKDGNQDMSRTKGGLNSKIHLAVDARYASQNFYCRRYQSGLRKSVHLIEGISVEVLLADRGYDANDILAYSVSAGMQTVILLQTASSGRELFSCPETLEGHYHFYAKTSDAFLATVTGSLYRYLGYHPCLIHVDTIYK